MKTDYEQDNLKLFNSDCMEVMALYPDKYFDLAIVDPPYGIGMNWTKDKNSKFYKHKSTYQNDSIPSKEYFQELFRVSKNQIIWGGNYYTDYLPAVNGWIVWDKQRSYLKQHMAEAELAWSSLKIPVRIISLIWNGFFTCERRYGNHPHEKPVKLYSWIYANYAQEGQKILDTHLGSGSNAIAAHYAKMGEFVGCELDEDYFKASVERIKKETKQLEFEFTVHKIETE